MQNGGGMPPFVYYQPVMTNNQQPSVVSSNTSSQTDTTDKGALGDKDLMSLLSKIDGLPVDMDAVYKKLNHFYRLQEAGINTRSLALTYLTAMKELKEAKFNKEQYNEAYKDVQKKSGLEETAVDNNGNVFFVDDQRNLQRISVDAYLQNRDKIGFKPLTNHQLLQYRASNPTQTMNNNLLTVVSNGIGLSYINKLIKEASVNLGDTEQSQTGYVKKEASNIMKGIEYLQEAGRQVGATDQSLSLDGLYKAKYIRKDQAEQVSAAINYLYDVLPDNAKQLLKLKTGSQKGVQDFIVNSVARRASSTYRFTADLIEDEEGNKPGTKKTATKSLNGTDTQFPKPYYFFVHGYGDPDSFKLQPNGSTESLNVTAISSPLTDDDGKNVGTQNATLQQIGTSTYGGYLDMNKASAAGQRIDNAYADKILINDDKIYTVALPFTKDSKTGIVMPNYELLPKITKINKELLAKGINVNNHNEAIQNKEKINEAYQMAGLPAFIDDNGEINSMMYQKFAMVNGYVYDKALGEDLKESDKELLLAYGKDIENEDMLETIVNKINRLNGHGLGDKGFEEYFDYNNWFDINGHNHYYLTNIYIPIKNNPTNFMTGSNLKMKEESFDTVRTRDVISQIQQATQYVDPNDLE